MNIRKKTIDNYLSLLNKLAELNEQKIKTVSLCIEHRVPTNTISIIEKLGFITSINKGVYKTSLHKFDPIHAKQVIEEARRLAYSAPPPSSIRGNKSHRVFEIEGVSNSETNHEIRRGIK